MEEVKKTNDKTPIQVGREYVRKLKIQAAIENTTIRDIIEKLVDQYLSKQSKTETE